MSEHASDTSSDPTVDEDRYPILMLKKNAQIPIASIARALLETHKALREDLQISPDSARSIVEQELSQLFQAASINKLWDCSMDYLLELQERVRRAVSLNKQTSESETRRQEDSSNPIVKAGTVSSETQARYPILQLKLNTPMTTEQVMDVLLKTNDALEELQRLHPNHQLIASVCLQISEFIQTVLGDEGSMLEWRHRSNLYSVQQNVLHLVSPAVREDDVARDLERVIQALYDVREAVAGQDHKNSQQSWDNQKSQARTFFRKKFFTPMILYLEQMSVFRFKQLQDESDVVETLSQIIAYFRGNQSTSDAPSSEEQVMDLMQQVLQKCQDPPPRKPARSFAYQPRQEENQGQPAQDPQKEAMDEKRRVQRQKVREAIGPTYSQLLELAKCLEDSLPNYPDLESLLTHTKQDVETLCAGMEDHGEEEVVVQVEKIRLEMEKYGDGLLAVLHKLKHLVTFEEDKPLTLPGDKKANQRPIHHLSEDELKERLRSFCQEAVKKTMASKARAHVQLWRQLELECQSLCPEDKRLEAQDCMSVLIKATTHLSTQLKTVSQAARRPCLLEERVQLVSSQADWLCTQLASQDTSAVASWMRVRFLRVLQRLFFLSALCSLMTDGSSSRPETVLCNAMGTE